MSKEDPERIDDLAIAAWDDHKPEAFVGWFADEFVWRDVTIPEPMRTREEATAYMRSWFTAFPDMRVQTTNRVVSHGAYFVRAEDGKIVEFRSHPDAAEMMVQLGLMPQG